jgi:hypothetical protein
MVNDLHNKLKKKEQKTFKFSQTFARLTDLEKVFLLPKTDKHKDKTTGTT